LARTYKISPPAELGITGLIGDGKLLRFKLNGSFVSESPFEFLQVTMQEVDILSILVSGGEFELGFNIDGNFFARSSNLGLSDLVRIVNSTHGLVFVGKIDNSGGYTQYLYVFMQGNLGSLVQKI
jgi:hypothetical protein